MVDLDLDVIRMRDGGILDDEDEFAEHQVRYGYPARRHRERPHHGRPADGGGPHPRRPLRAAPHWLSLVT